MSLKTMEMYTTFGTQNRRSVYYFRDWKPWKCIPSSELKTQALEVYTTFGLENLNALTMIIVHACTVIIVHACTISIVRA